jgi:hypothetical protein
MFLRDVVTRLLYKKQWSLFAAPITNDDLHGYRDRVTEPMDLSTLLWKVDGEKYLTVDAFLEDSHLITKSAHEYWGEQTDDADGRIMLSKAHALEDTIAQMVSALDPQLVVRCQEIAKARGTRSQQGQGAMKEQNIESDSAGNERPSRSGGELVAPKGAPVWQNADFVKDPEALARQMKKKAREEAAAAASDEPEPTPMEEEAPTTPIVAVAADDSAKKVGPPATSDEKLAEIKTNTLGVLVSNALRAKFDFSLLENSASEMSREAKRAMEDASGRGVLCVAALAAAIGAST